MIEQEEKTACAALVWAADFIFSATATNLNKCKNRFLVCYCSYMNLISHAVKLLLDHTVGSMQKSERQLFFGHSGNYVFERLNINKQVGKHMLWTLEIITICCDFWTFQCSEILINVQIKWARSDPNQNKIKTKKMCFFFPYFRKCWRHIASVFSEEMISPCCVCFECSRDHGVSQTESILHI